LFMDAQGTPRVPHWMPVTKQGNMSCTVITSPGTLALVQDNEYQSPQVSADSQPVDLTQCRVTTTHIVRMRTSPSLNGEIIIRIPYNYTMQAIQYVPGWYRVIFGSDSGWVSADYLSTQGDCE
jgi:Bacterial SH3 domain